MGVEPAGDSCTDAASAPGDERDSRFSHGATLPQAVGDDADRHSQRVEPKARGDRGGLRSPHGDPTVTQSLVLGGIDFAPSLPGDVTVFDVTPETPLLIQKGSFLCAEMGVEIDTQWGGMRNLIGGEGGFLLRASGQGKVVLSCYGALDRFELQPGQQVVVDTNHMVAFAESVQMELKRASDSFVKSAKTGEGFVFVFTGPGELMMQSRNPDEIVQYIYRNMPASRN
ncbi:MAG: TIGR00266 family protein [Acidimicrobiia bacterium]|nr:TIGR00266 family protein [Acidimicrobiia bacterium]